MVVIGEGKVERISLRRSICIEGWVARRKRAQERVEEVVSWPAASMVRN